MSDANDALTQAMEAGWLAQTATANVKRSFAAFQKIESLFHFLRLPPELAQIAETVDIAEAPACIGRYPVIKLLGRGGFGRVVLAYDDRLDRRVAIKYALGPDTAILAKARKVAQLRHDGIATIYAVEEISDGSICVVMEYLDGGSLRERLLRDGKLKYEDAINLMRDVAGAVQYAHQSGFVHRDLKPENILFDAEHRPHVVDFGLAVHESQQADRAGEVSGTWRYMAPEQVRGEVPHIDGRTDVWAMGVVLYEILTGAQPFTGRDRQELTDQIEHREPKPPRQIDPAIPARVQDVVLKCLRKRAIERFASAADLVDALHGATRDRDLSRRGMLVAAGLALAVVAVLLAASWYANKPAADTTSPPVATTELDGILDVYVWRPQRDDIRGAPIQKPGVAPLRAGDQFRIEATVSRPAFLYIASIDADGILHMVYPWIPERGETRPTHEEPVVRVVSPSNDDARGWPVTPGRAGMSTILLLGTERPMPDAPDLGELLSDVGTISPLNAEPVAFFDGGVPTSREHTRSTSFAKSEAIVDPILQFHSRLATKLKKHFTLVRAVTYPDLGR
ncbi:MAG: protein kinase [Pirellulales bacterium]